ncbi:hypothetical protein RZS08_02145, partial [Arthrospira platensis SPKY1]|nr:hypothetical protein [Arthrospira platensis SPKY1]
VNDTEQPQINCPADIVVAINPDGVATVESGVANIVSQGPCGVTLTYEQPFGTDNCPNYLITNEAGLGATDNCTTQGFGACFFYGFWSISVDGDGSVSFNAPSND